MGLVALALAVFLPEMKPLSPLLAGFLGGVAGSLVDRMLGANVLAAYLCHTSGLPTESRVHRCGTPTQLVSGFRFINNDLVNLFATLTGAVVGLVVVWLLHL